jgi:hypothetical protein
MKILLFTICILIFSCKNKNKTEKPTQLDSIFIAENFDTTKLYSKPCCLNYKGKPLLTIGQNVLQLDTSLSFRRDPNGEFEKYSEIITDYLSLDDNLTIKQTTGSLNGDISFSADKKGRIFKITASWLVDIEMTDRAETEAINTFRQYYFPCLPDNFRRNKQFSLSHKDFIEKINFYSSPDSADIDHGYKPHSSLTYEVSLLKTDSNQ